MRHVRSAQAQARMEILQIAAEGLMPVELQPELEPTGGWSEWNYDKAA